MTCTRRAIGLGIGLALLAAAPPAAAGRCPNVLLLVDGSASMAQALGGMGISKYQLVRTAINQFVGRLPLRFGLEVFGHSGDPSTCYSDTRVLVACGPDTARQIALLFNGVNPGPQADTNTGEAIRRAYTDGHLDDPDRPDYIVLFTDGQPSCNAGDLDLPTYTVSEITAAAKRNPSIHTFVIGLGDAAPAAWNAMALAGMEPLAGCDPKNPAKPCYYAATSIEAFKLALDAIFRGISQEGIGLCDDSCFAVGCPAGDVCAFPQACAAPGCVPDPCLGKTCDPGKYCSGGTCLSPCPRCDPGQRCVADTCVVDPCAQTCPSPDQACDPSSGQCLGNKCQGALPRCPLPQHCDPLTGCCAADPCRLVNCPTGSSCTGGYCMQDPPAPDLGPIADLSEVPDLTAPVLLADTGCTCHLGSRRATGDGFATVAAIVAIALLRRRRQRESLS